MKLLVVFFALVLLTGASLAPGAHVNTKLQTPLARAKKSGPEMWKFGLVGLALAGFLIRKRI